MKDRGIEPVLPGHTEDEGFKWCIDSIQKVLPKAEEYGVLMALENHWGLARTPEGQLRILDAIKSPWLGALMDTGNFLEDPYPKLEMIAPRTVFVQAKTYEGGGEWYSLDLDYTRIAAILKKVGYHGYVALEFEGKANPDVAVPAQPRPASPGVRRLIDRRRRRYIAVTIPRLRRASHAAAIQMAQPGLRRRGRSGRRASVR